MRVRWLDGVPSRGLMLLILLLAALILFPAFANDYLITVLILIFYFA
jgi:branched-chain amino acid transport system permease protein